MKCISWEIIGSFSCSKYEGGKIVADLAIKSVVIIICYFLSYIYVLRYIQCYSWGALNMIGRNVYKIFSAVGAPAHEAAHALAALLCGFRITNINIFKHVEFMVPSNLRGIIGSFFVSIAPALFNIIIFTIICSKSSNIYLNFLMFLVLISCIAPSDSDVKGMFIGVVIGIITIAVFTYIAGWAMPSLNAYVKNSIILVGKFYAVYLGMLTGIVTIKGCIINRTISPIYIVKLYKDLLINGLQRMARCR